MGNISGTTRNEVLEFNAKKLVSQELRNLLKEDIWMLNT